MHVRAGASTVKTSPIYHPAACNPQAEDLEEASSQVQVYSMAQPGNQWIDCRMEEDSAFVTVQTLSGHVHRQAVRVVTLHTERAGRQRLTSSPTHRCLCLPLRVAALHAWDTAASMPPCPAQL